MRILGVWLHPGTNRGVVQPSLDFVGGQNYAYTFDKN